MFIRNDLFNELPFNDIIQKLIESGIIDHWKSLILKKYTNDSSFTYESTPASDYLSDAFVMLIMGIIVSRIIFSVECFVKKM